MVTPAQLVRAYRSVRAVIIVLPFILLTTYLFCFLMSYLGISKDSLMDLTAYISPIMAAIMYALSNSVGLCKWHKLASLLPILPYLTMITSLYYYQLPFHMVYITHAIIFVLTIISAIKVFICNQRARNSEQR